MSKLLNAGFVLLILLVLTVPSVFAQSILDVSIRGDAGIHAVLGEVDSPLITIEVDEQIPKQNLKAQIFDKQYFFDQCIGTTCTLLLPTEARELGSHDYAIAIVDGSDVVDSFSGTVVVDGFKPSINALQISQNGDSLLITYAVEDKACQNCASCSGILELEVYAQGVLIDTISVLSLECSVENEYEVSMASFESEDTTEICVRAIDAVNLKSGMECGTVYSSKMAPEQAGFELIYEGYPLQAVSYVALDAQLRVSIADDNLDTDSVFADLSALNPVIASYKNVAGDCSASEAEMYVCLFDVTIAGERVGDHLVSVSGLDLAGNSFALEETISLTLDTTAPQLAETLQELVVKQGSNEMVVSFVDESAIIAQDVSLDLRSVSGGVEQASSCEAQDGSWDCYFSFGVSSNVQGSATVVVKDIVGNEASYSFSLNVDSTNPKIGTIEKSSSCPVPGEGLILSAKVQDASEVSARIDASSISSTEIIEQVCEEQEDGEHLCEISISGLLGAKSGVTMPFTVIDAAGNTAVKSVQVETCDVFEGTSDFVRVDVDKVSSVDLRTLSYTSFPVQLSLRIITSGSSEIIDKEMQCEGAQQIEFLSSTANDHLMLLRIQKQSVEDLELNEIELNCQMASKVRRGTKIFSEAEVDEFVVTVPTYNLPLGSIDAAIEEKIARTQSRIDELDDDIETWSTVNDVFHYWGTISESAGAANAVWQDFKATKYAFTCAAATTAKEICCNAPGLIQAGLGLDHAACPVDPPLFVQQAACQADVSARQAAIGGMTADYVAECQKAIPQGKDVTQKGNPQEIINKLTNMQTAIAGPHTNIGTAEAQAVMASCNAWLGLEQSWEATCKSTSESHNYVEEYIWPTGLYGGNPVGAINKGAIMIFNKCALIDVNAWFSIGADALASYGASQDWYGKGGLAGDGIDTWGKDGYSLETIGKGLEGQASAYLLDPLRDRKVAYGGMCFPAIEYNLKKEKNINCIKKKCLEEHAKLGLPTTVCDEMFDLRMCTFVDGPVDVYPEFADAILNNLPNILIGVTWKMGCAEYINQARECDEPGVCVDGNNPACGVAGSVLLLQEIGDLVFKLISFTDRMSDMTGDDYC